METFITEVSTTRTNIAIASRMASLRPLLVSSGALVPASPVIEGSPPQHSCAFGRRPAACPSLHRVPPETAVLVSQTHVRRDSQIGNPIETQCCLSGSGTRASSTRPIALATRCVCVLHALAFAGFLGQG